MKNRHGSLMQNIVIDMCEKFYYDRLKNDGALRNGKYDNKKKKKKKNVRSHWGPVYGSKNRLQAILQQRTQDSAITCRLCAERRQSDEQCVVDPRLKSVMQVVDSK